MTSTTSTPPREEVKALCHRRLMLDIKEFYQDPYPNIKLFTFDEDLSAACLVLTPETYHKPLHLTVKFPSDYPLHPPRVEMNSQVEHPNVLGNFICATILRYGDEYTPAYTLKSIAIQLLSFFASETMDQEHGDGAVALDEYRNADEHLLDTFECSWCKSGTGSPLQQGSKLAQQEESVSKRPEDWPTLHLGANMPRRSPKQAQSYINAPADKDRSTKHITNGIMANDRLPNEILLLVLEQLDKFKDLTNFARAWPRVSAMVGEFDIIRQRELQCFCLKDNYKTANLGVGVSIERGQISSEFDLLAQQAFRDMRVRHSVHRVPFQYWLPLPISHRHWRLVKDDAYASLKNMSGEIKSPMSSEAQVLFTFMNDVVVNLNLVAEGKSNRKFERSRTNLRHASEKAIESYFHLFHLQLCLATENPSIVQRANTMLRKFADGARSKKDCPNLGHLLIALLISDVEVTDKLMRQIITEAITRNVVWLLDRKGADMPELSHMEVDRISAYRLDKTFQASRTSYRLLMFSELFRRTARPSHQKPLAQVRDELFKRHGAPPRDAANRLASEVRRLHTVNDFPAFMREMGLKSVPHPEAFTNVLRQTVHESMKMGYSKWGMSPLNALMLRIEKDPNVFLTKEERAKAQAHVFVKPRDVSFFPSFRPNKKSPPRRA
ncbi:hypothetical protein F4778DRAFT_728860 [Xylariomycetidae sp. FL2044]|nr:hypothetical protein F4778DRAFT_728860 [Xylariomycetidae sp. FL2044]